MLRRLALTVTALTLTLLPIALGVSCQSSNKSIVGPGGQMIPQDFPHAGSRYISTGVRVATQETGAETPSNVMYIGSTSFPGGEYGVYLIEGVDENEAIALKIGQWGGCSYYKYERLCGQEEPADVVYEGKKYAKTGEIIDIQRATELAAFGEPESVSYLSSVVHQGTTYDVYSIHIQGEDRSQEIAVKIAKAGKTVGFHYYYFTYENQSWREAAQAGVMKS